MQPTQKMSRRKQCCVPTVDLPDCATACGSGGGWFESASGPRWIMGGPPAVANSGKLRGPPTCQSRPPRTLPRQTNSPGAYKRRWKHRKITAGFITHPYRWSLVRRCGGATTVARRDGENASAFRTETTCREITMTCDKCENALLQAAASPGAGNGNTVGFSRGEPKTEYAAPKPIRRKRHR